MLGVTHRLFRGGGHCGGWGDEMPAGYLPSKVPRHSPCYQATFERREPIAG
jgi:hypothetical protein